MAKDITLKNKNGETRYPKSVTALIYENGTGKTLQTIIDEMRQVDAATNTRTQHFKADVNNLDTLKNKTDIGLYNYVGNGWRGSVSVCYDSADNVSQVALSSSTPSYNSNTLTWLSAQPCAMARTYTNGAWSHWEKVGAPVVNDLTTGGTDKALSAEMGKTLKEGLDALGPKIGEETKTYGTEILTASYYIKSDGTLSYSTSYITSTKIAITKGTKVKVKAGTPSASAHCFAAYEKDGTLIEVWIPSGTGTGGASTHEYTAPRDVDVRVSTGSNASYANVFEFTVYANGLLGAVNNISESIGNIEDHIEEIDASIDEIGVEDVSYNPTSFSRTGYIKSDGTIASHNSYYLSTKISVKKGCTVNIKAGTPSLSAYPLAVYSLGGTLIEAWCPSSIASIQTHTYTATDDVEILACCNNNATYVQSFKLVVKGYGVKGDLSELQPMVDSVIQKTESLEDSVTNLVGERSFSFVGAYTTKKQVDFSTIVGHKYRIVFPESGWAVSDIYDYNTGLAVFVASSFDGTSYTEYSSTVRYVNRGVPSGYIDLVVETAVTSMWIRADNGSEFDIKVVDMDAKSIASISSAIDSIKNVQTISPFSFAPIVHHINVAKYSNVTIPSQTLLDVSYAKRIGAKYIEANVHKCSDGVYVCRHGNQGKLGSGLLFDGDTYDEDTLFTSISSTDLRTYVKCNSVLSKWQSPIPTLDEFCAECKKVGIGILVQCIDSGVLPIVRQYLTDDMIIAYNLSQRGDFRGTIMAWTSATSAEDMLEVAEGYGAPFLFGWNNWSSVSDSIKKDALAKMHKNGYMVGTAYLNTEGVINALKLGIDEIAATYFLINTFDDGNLHHIASLDDTNLSISGGVTYDSTTKTISAPSSGLIKIQNEAYADKIAKVSVRIRYSGTLGIYVGVASNGNYGLANYVSDGTKEIAFAGVSEFRDTLLVISAAAQTTIYDLKIDTSLVY